MLDQNALEVISLKQSDLAKSHFSKAELERILKIYKICKQPQTNPSLQKLYSGKLAWICATAQKYIKDFAAGRLTVDIDAAVMMNDFVGEFGRTYKHEGNVLKYVYTPEAKQARIVLAKAVYRQKIAAEEAKAKAAAAKAKVSETKAVQKTSRLDVSKIVSKRKVSTSKVRREAVLPKVRARQSVSVRSLRQASKQQKQEWLSKFRKSLINASQLMTKEIKSTGKGIKIAALAGLLSYPLLSSLGKVDDVNITRSYDTLAQSTKVEKSFFDRVSTDSVVIDEDYFALNDSEFVSGLPENIFWGEYVSDKKDTGSKEEPSELVAQNSASEGGVSQEENADELSVKDSFCVPYSEKYAKAIAVNDSAYKEFALTLTNQFLYNISEMKSGRNLYREKEKLIGKYYTYNHIVPNKSCESMTFATFLDVLERDRNKQNYIHEACRDLLFQVANPHGCYSNIHTFKGVSCRNLRKSLSERLQEDAYGIYMVWIPRGGGMYHRQTVIGVGNGEAYLLAFNNNRAIKMDVDNLNKISASRGYFADLGGKIFERANTLAAEDYERQQMIKENNENNNYMAQVLDLKRSYSN